MAERTHLYPSRTQKLSSPAPKILGGRLPGKIGHCRFYKRASYESSLLFSLCFAKRVKRDSEANEMSVGAHDRMKMRVAGFDEKENRIYAVLFFIGIVKFRNPGVSGGFHFRLSAVG